MPASATASSRRSPYARLLDRAMRLLAARDHSEQELRRKLAAPSPLRRDNDEESVAPGDIERIITLCLENHWLDDARFAQRYVESRASKGYGPQRIAQELHQKGITREVTSFSLAECGLDWESQAREQARRRFGEPLPDRYPEKAKVQRFLLQRGFYMEDIQAVYRNFSD
ncbi:recombination regulator RecX [Erwinia sp. CPCC 100877]|nr:recombination regulator RecX [Erwinia sp. CPCC 100877]